MFRKIPGVIQIEICDDPASVSIFAESKEAAQKAKQVSWKSTSACKHDITFFRYSSSVKKITWCLERWLGD